MECEHCYKEKPDVKFRINPYEADVNNTEKYEWICDQCEDMLADAI